MNKRASPIIALMLDEIANIEQAMAPTTFEEFGAHWQLRRAVQRGIEVVSEASRRLPDELKATHGEIDWRQVSGIGNILRHEYHKISDKVIWDLVHGDLVPLKLALEAMRRQVEGLES